MHFLSQPPSLDCSTPSFHLHTRGTSSSGRPGQVAGQARSPNPIFTITPPTQPLLSRHRRRWRSSSSSTIRRPACAHSQHTTFHPLLSSPFTGNGAAQAAVRSGGGPGAGGGAAAGCSQGGAGPDHQAHSPKLRQVSGIVRALRVYSNSCICVRQGQGWAESPSAWASTPRRRVAGRPCCEWEWYDFQGGGGVGLESG